MSDNEDALRCADKLTARSLRQKLDQLDNDAAAHLRRLVRENEAMRKSAPLCEKHQPSGGTRSNCLVCVGERLQASLSRISYVCGEPNEMEVSLYDAHYDEAAVVEQVRSLRAKNEAKDALLRQAVEALDLGRDALHELACAAESIRRYKPKMVESMNAEVRQADAAIAAIRQHLEGRA